MTAPDAQPPANSTNRDTAPPTALQQRLLEWFAAYARDLPWRRTRDPYRILVSEMMLQQTQVDRVLPKYAAFLEVFPTLDALAAAPTAEVIKQWAGLGYNRRAVNLQRIARTVRDDYGGVFPRAVEELRTLPGIGPYTAGAVACFAFEQDVAFMDVNIRRVLLRLLHGAGTDDLPSDRELLARAQALVPAGQGWAWNQGLMELGALVCTSTPRCWRCPLQPDCRAYAAWRRADEHLFSAAATDSPNHNAADQALPEVFPAAAPRSKRRIAERRPPPFVGSNRYYRGRALDCLRALEAGHSLPLAQLGAQVKPDFDPTKDQDWLHKLVVGLAQDGLAEIVGDEVRLPAT